MANQSAPVFSPWPSVITSAKEKEENNTNTEGAVGLGIQANMMPSQQHLYLRLSQLLECEIWNHNETRAALAAEEVRRHDLEQQLQQQTYHVNQCEHACRTTYAALDSHRAENAKLRLELDEVTTELTRVKQGVTVSQSASNSTIAD